MADINIFLQKILEAIYGEEVRGSIHDALAAMNAEASSAMSFAATAKDSASAAAASAEASASAAVQKAGEALASAEAAQSSEDSAKSSEIAATTAAGAAGASETAAKLSESNAAESAEAAQIANTAAQSAADNADTNANAAAQSAVDAATSARSAQQYSGNPPKPQNGTWWIWDADKQAYVDSGMTCELPGPAGTSIVKIERTDGTGAPGTVDTYTVTLTDGTTSTFQVYNGKDGQGSGDMTKTVYDPQNKATDIYQYVDDALKDIPAAENAVTVPGGGEMEVPEGLGPGPYTIVMDGQSGSGGGGNPTAASNVSYDSAESGLEAETVQSAIDKLSSVKADAWRVSNPNLLDNWYLANPINQRGQTEYAGRGYGIDRFKSYADTISINIGDYGIKISSSATSATPTWGQELSPDLVKYLIGKTVTFSCLTGNVSSERIYIYIRCGNSNNEFVASSPQVLLVSNNLLHTTFTVPNCEKISVRVIINATSETVNDYAEIKAVKLELGSVQTLAHQNEYGAWVLNDPPPDYGTELLKCQRYFIRLSAKQVFTQTVFLQAFTSLRAVSFLPLPIEMRLMQPTIRAQGVKVCGVMNNATNIQKLNCTLISRGVLANGINVEVQQPDSLFIPNNMYFLEFANAGDYIDLDANL